MVHVEVVLRQCRRLQRREVARGEGAASELAVQLMHMARDVHGDVGHGAVIVSEARKNRDYGVTYNVFHLDLSASSSSKRQNGHQGCWTAALALVEPSCGGARESALSAILAIIVSEWYA